MTKRFLAFLIAVMICIIPMHTAFAEQYDVTEAPADWDEALTQNPSQTQLDETPAEQSEEEASISVAAYEPVYITSQMAQTAVDWMSSQVGSSSSASTWNGRCLAMVRAAYEQVGVYQSGYGTGPIAAQKLSAGGYLHTDENPPAGTLVMFGVCSNSAYDPYGYGHAAMSIGGGKIVHAYAGAIRIDYISTVVKHGYPYLGWGVWHAEYGNTMENVQASASDSSVDTEQLEAFVERLYTVALNRSSDPVGKAMWVEQLKNGTNTGANTAWGCFMSQEFLGRNLSDDEFLDVIYRTLFDREPDSVGKAGWLSALNNGVSREYVISGGVNSDEFTALCGKFGVKRGTVTPSQPRDKNLPLTSFVNRLYNKLLDRQGEAAGLNSWCSLILSGASTPKEVAYGCVFSDEFKSKQYSNEIFVEYMYRTFFGREYDEQGKETWLSALNNGMTREEVFNGFADSAEFAQIVKSFGL